MAVTALVFGVDRHSSIHGNSSIDDPGQGAAAMFAPASQAPARHASPVSTGTTVHDPSGETGAPAGSSDLPARIRQLIDAEGGAATIARRCGFSAATVRSWRDGMCDISRGRCVTLSRCLGVSLLWIVVGEGPMKLAPPTPSHVPGRSSTGQHGTVDPRLLADALRLLRSYVSMVGGSLDSSSRADLMAELYNILSSADDPGFADRLVAFQNALGARLRGGSGACG
jgi:hypothetical protein